MKLIDLLVQELPKRGGWPDGVNEIGQDYDGELMFYGRGNARTRIYLPLSSDHRDICCHNGDKVTKDRYELALAASKNSAWNGEGVPPVGIKCEHCPGGTTQHEWEVVTVAGVHKNTSTGFTDYWLVRENGSSYIVGNPYRFRPLRTEAEKALESAKHIIAELCRDSASNGHSADLIMEAITAGKIPGVKLDD